MDQRMLFREFHSRGEAEIVRELLPANGIESFVNSDDCGSVRPDLAFSRGIQLYVVVTDAPMAEKILEESMTELPVQSDKEES